MTVADDVFRRLVAGDNLSRSFVEILTLGVPEIPPSGAISIRIHREPARRRVVRNVYVSFIGSAPCIHIQIRRFQTG